MWLQTKIVGLKQVSLGGRLLSGFAVLGLLTTLLWSSSAIAQDTSPSLEELPSQEDFSENPDLENPDPESTDSEELSPQDDSFENADSEDSELALSDIRAFDATTDTDVHSVESLDPADFNALLLTSYQNQAIWVNDPLWVGLQFLQFLGQPITGTDQQVSVSIPGEWEPGLDFEFARVVIEDKGWLDDAIAGERYVIWVVPGTGGEPTIQRALRANFCSRPFQEFYSIQDCP